jgi:hypothetical protein
MIGAALILFGSILCLLVFLPEIQKLIEFLKSFDRSDETEMQEDHDEYPCL